MSKKKKVRDFSSGFYDWKGNYKKILERESQKKKSSIKDEIFRETKQWKSNNANCDIMVDKSLLARIKERKASSEVELQDILDLCKAFQQIVQEQESIRKELKKAYINYENRYKEFFYPKGIDGICVKGRLYADVSSFIHSTWENTPDWEVWLRIKDEEIEFGQGRTQEENDFHNGSLTYINPYIEITSTKLDFWDILFGNIDIETIFYGQREGYGEDPIVINQNYENDEAIFFFGELLAIPSIALADLLEKNINNVERDEDIYDKNYWNSDFKDRSKNNKDILKSELGITAEDFKEYLKKWKKENST